MDDRSPSPETVGDGGRPVVELAGVQVVRGGRTLLHTVDLCVRSGQRWVILGPNGSGKITLLRVVSLSLHPTTGTVEVLGGRLGKVDVRTHRRRLGLISSALTRQLRGDLTAAQVVETGRNAALEAWWHTYTAEDREAASGELERMGVLHLADARFGDLSSGERQRVLLARCLLGRPELLLLDEPTSGLDLGGREDLVERIGTLSRDPAAPPMILVTHHPGEIPDGFTHALLLRDGAVSATGPIAEVLTEPRISACFGCTLRLERRDGRWLCWSPRGLTHT